MPICDHDKFATRLGKLVHFCPLTLFLGTPLVTTARRYSQGTRADSKAASGGRRRKVRCHMVRGGGVCSRSMKEGSSVPTSFAMASPSHRRLALTLMLTAYLCLIELLLTVFHKSWQAKVVKLTLRLSGTSCKCTGL